MAIGRYEPDTARWVIDQIKSMMSRQYYSPAELLAGLGSDANQRSIHVKNTDAADAPGYACMQVVGIQNPYSSTVVDRTYLEVEKPSDQYGRGGWYVFNGPEEIAADDYGVAYGGPSVKVLGFSGSFGDRCLPIIDDWSITKDPTGWMHFAGSDDTATDLNRVLVSPILSSVAIFETPSGGIPAASSDLGKATCDLYSLDLDGSNDASYVAADDEDDTQIEHTVYNMALESVAGSAKIQAVLVDGLWIANWEEC